MLVLIVINNYSATLHHEFTALLNPLQVNFALLDHFELLSASWRLSLSLLPCCFQKVFDLAHGGPRPGLELFAQLDRFRVLCCGTFFHLLFSFSFLQAHFVCCSCHSSNIGLFFIYSPPASHLLIYYFCPGFKVATVLLPGFLLLSTRCKQKIGRLLCRCVRRICICLSLELSGALLCTSAPFLCRFKSGRVPPVAVLPMGTGTQRRFISRRQST